MATANLAVLVFLGWISGFLFTLGLAWPWRHPTETWARPMQWGLSVFTLAGAAYVGWSALIHP